MRIGVSQCLLGDEVRYDGGHKRNAFVVELLGSVFAWVGVCPEVEAGMGVPREPVRLKTSGEGIKMIGVGSGTDHTESMNAFAVTKLEDLAESGLRGYVLKSGSPSCGLQVPVEGERDGAPGLFARALGEWFPALPLIEETDLADSGRRQNFVERVFAYDRQMQFFSKERSIGQLVMAHVQARLQLEAHQPGLHAEIGELFKTSELSYEELGVEYLSRFMEALRIPATTASHFGVLKTIFDEIKPNVDPPVLKELARSLQDYRQGNVPLGVPLTLLRHYIRVQEHPHLHQQTYLEPGPRELLLRTQV